jgi:hypothetical protein
VSTVVFQKEIELSQYVDKNTEISLSKELIPKTSIVKSLAYKIELIPIIDDDKSSV